MALASLGLKSLMVTHCVGFHANGKGKQSELGSGKKDVYNRNFDPIPRRFMFNLPRGLDAGIDVDVALASAAWESHQAAERLIYRGKCEWLSKTAYIWRNS